LKKTVYILTLIGALVFTAACAEVKKINSPFFNITISELETCVGELPESIRSVILKAPVPFLEQLHAVLQQPEEFTWLVDKKNSLASDYAPGDLVDLKDYAVKIAKNGLLVRKALLASYLEMVKAAKAENVVLVAASTYRSYKNQEWLFNYWVEQLGRAQAEIESAHAGMSQHQLGTTIDFNPIDDVFGTSAAYRWLDAHAWEYGFTLSYPEGGQSFTGYKYEPWHWRYVGKAAAAVCKTYFAGIQQYWLEFLHRNKAWFAARGLK